MELCLVASKNLMGVGGLQHKISPLGQQITDEIKCPLLEITHMIFLRRSSSILKAVSVVHKCSCSSKFINKHIPRLVERERQ